MPRTKTKPAPTPGVGLNGVHHAADSDPTPEPVPPPPLDPPGLPPDPPFTLYVRSMTAPRASAREFTFVGPETSFAQAWAAARLKNLVDPVVEWADRTRAAVLDVDYHQFDAADRPDRSDTETRAASVYPTPFAYHTSSGGGCKLYYRELDGLAADELAAAAAVCWRQTDRFATFEIKTQSRHPGYPRTIDNGGCGPVRWLTPSSDTGPFGLEPDSDAGGGLGIDHPAVRQFLADHGFEPDGRYPHERCVIDPRPGSHSDPVVVVDRGVYCHRCEAKGYGHPRRPGMRFWDELVTGSPGKKSELRNMVSRLCHWEHARYVLAARYDLPESVLKPAYALLLKRTHGVDDTRIRTVFAPDLKMVRLKSGWVTSDLRKQLANPVRAVQSLPAVKEWIDDPKKPGTQKLVTVPARIDFLLQTSNPGEFGYPPLEVHRGYDFRRFQKLREPTREEFDQAFDRNPDAAPRYLDPDERSGWDEAWRTVGKAFPGVDRYYVTLLLVVRGAASFGLAQFPFVVVRGPSGSGKTSSVKIAAGVVGGREREPQFSSDDIRFRALLGEAISGNSFVVLDELLKAANASKMSAVAVLDTLLSLGPSGSYHKMHVGATDFGDIPPVVMTDVAFPDEILADEQFGRRFTFVHLTSKVEWEGPMRDQGVREPHLFRLAAPRFAHAADSILSHVQDEFFIDPPDYHTLLARVAEFCGVEIDDPRAVALQRRHDALFQLFGVVCDGSTALPASVANRWSGRGYRLLKQSDSGPLAEAWEQVSDARTGGKWDSSRAVEEVDWQLVLGTPWPVRAAVARDKAGTILLRFSAGGTAKQPKWVNDEVRTHAEHYRGWAENA